MEPGHIETRLKEHFPDAKLKLTDLTGTQDHWQLYIESKAFEGLSMVQQHQLVYKALGEYMHGPIHALSITAKTLS